MKSDPTADDFRRDLEADLALCDRATAGPWYTVDPTWLPPGAPTYVVAGHPDPHVGKAVLDAIDVDVWEVDEDDPDAGPDYSQSDADVEFAAAAREGWPAAIRLARHFRAEAASLSASLEVERRLNATAQAELVRRAAELEREVERLRGCEVLPGTLRPKLEDCERALKGAEARLAEESLECGRLRNQALVLEHVRDERDAFRADLAEVGRAIGCGHVGDGLARCVGEVVERAEAAGKEVERLQKMVDGFAARIAEQSELLGKKAEGVPLTRLRELVIAMRRYVLFHGVLLGECVAWEELKRLTGVGQDHDCPSEEGLEDRL